MKTGTVFFDKIWLCIGLVAALGVVCRVQAQGGGPKFVVDPSWPKPLPEKWVTGQVSGVCVDAQNNVFIVNRNDITDKEAEIAQQAPPFIEFDPDGNVVNSFGDWNVVPNITHGCFIDYGKLLMQIGKRGVVDTSDGTLKGRALNSSHTQFYMPSNIAGDPVNGDVYVSDGYGNSRIGVFDRSGKFLRQWGHQGTKEEADAGVGGAFMQVVHCVALGNDGLVYVCDRQGDRIQVFDKMETSKITSGSREETAFPIIGAPRGGSAFLPTGSRNTFTWPTGATSRSRFSTMPAEKFSRASGVLVTRSANLSMATL
jgi:DNA-binding beta-propeller fold protein YncE